MSLLILKPATTNGFSSAAGEFTFRNLGTSDEFEAAYRLRHQIFAEHLKWVPQSDTHLEIDSYDAFANHFGIFGPGQNLVGYARLITADHPFMLEREFQCVVSATAIRKQRDTCEATRLCVSPRVRTRILSSDYGPLSIAGFAFRGIYEWCTGQEIRYLYAVSERGLGKLLRMNGFHCEVIGDPKKMPDGVIAYLLLLDFDRSLIALRKAS